jgi:hypothetical protein
MWDRSPPRVSIKCSVLAQLVEQVTVGAKVNFQCNSGSAKSNHRVAGSSPADGAKYMRSRNR